MHAAGTAEWVVLVQKTIRIEPNGSVIMPHHGATLVDEQCMRVTPIGDNNALIGV